MRLVRVVSKCRRITAAKQCVRQQQQQQQQRGLFILPVTRTTTTVWNHRNHTSILSLGAGTTWWRRDARPTVVVPVPPIIIRHARALSSSSSGSTTTAGGTDNKTNSNHNNRNDESSNNNNNLVTTTSTADIDNHSNDDNVDDDSSLIVSHFKNRIVHQLWTERAKAKKMKKGTTTSSSNKHCPSPSSAKGGEGSTVMMGKTPCQSETKVEYPFTSNELLAESYRSPWNTMRIGRVLEDLDALAGNIAFYHVRREHDDDNTSTEEEEIVHPLIVTASVDRIRLRHSSPSMSSDQILSGRVTYVGTSSMEIRMHCRTKKPSAAAAAVGDNEEEEPWLEAFFTFVTLDPTTKKSLRITPLLPQTPQEQADFDLGAQKAALKKRRRRQPQQQKATSSSTATTTTDDSASIQQHAEALLQQARPLLLNMPSLAARDSLQMSSTKMQNALIAQPQVRNLHNRIFGGFLMRRAFELAFANAYVFGGARPVFREVDEISFAAPVDVGDLLVFNSRVLYTSQNQQPSPIINQQQHDTTNNDNNDATTTATNKDDYPLVHLEVEAWVTIPERADAKLSNQFYFTFAIVGDGDDDKNNNDVSSTTRRRPPQQQLRQILPANIDEATRMAVRMAADRDQAAHDENVTTS